MVVYKFTRDAIVPIETPTFSELGITERSDLQRLLRDQIEIIAPDTLVISEEFADWDDSRRRIDLLAIDKEANLVVVELKRTDDGGHMELQAIRYAAMVSSMTFAQAVRFLSEYLKSRGDTRDAEQTILTFLGWPEPREDDFAADVRVVLASAEFGKEITTAVLWLRDKGVDIRCVRIKPYGTKDLTLLDVQQVVPLPEAEDYQIRVREKNQLERVARASARDYTKYQVTIDGHITENLPKRRAVLQIVRAIVEAGVAPETLQRDISWKYLYFKAEGHLTGAQIEAAMLAHGKTETIRYFTADTELVYFGGATYAVSNQWGPRSMEAVQNMIARCPSRTISCEPTK